MTRPSREGGRCWFWHDWPKWSAPKLDTYLWSSPLFRIPEQEVQYFTQERTCARCGRYERRRMTPTGESR